MSELWERARPYQHWLMLLPLMASGLWFFVLERVVLSPPNLMHVRLDDLIPFLPVFVVPYVFWYLFVALPGVYLFFKHPGEFSRYATFLTLGMLLACTVYTLFPNGQALRPMLHGLDDPLSMLIRYIYRVDTPTNSAPSIHVIYSIAAYTAIVYCNNKRVRWLNQLSLAIAILCILSTVFVKQHSVVDLVTGLAVSALLYLIIYRRDLIYNYQFTLWPSPAGATAPRKKGPAAGALFL